MFEPRKEILDQVSQLVEVRVELWIRFLAIGFPRDHRIHFCGTSLFANRLGVVCFVGDEVLGSFYFLDDLRRCFDVVNFTPSDFKIDRISMRIGA